MHSVDRYQLITYSWDVIQFLERLDSRRPTVVVCNQTAGKLETVLSYSVFAVRLLNFNDILIFSLYLRAFVTYTLCFVEQSSQTIQNGNVKLFTFQTIFHYNSRFLLSIKRPFKQGNRSPGSLDTASIINITTEACGIFSKDHFANAYKNSVVDHVKAAKLSQNSNDSSTLGVAPLSDGSGKNLSKSGKKPAMRLNQAPAPVYVIKSGMLMKRGAAVKNWKRRHFTALNKGNNFCIVYSEDDANSTAIGHIYCSGYVRYLFLIVSYDFKHRAITIC